MDRNEAVLRELNLYPLWVRRDLPAPQPEMRPEQVQEVNKRIDQIRKKHKIRNPVWIMPIIESALGVVNAFPIASAAGNVVSLAIGLEDYTADLGTKRTKEGTESFLARTTVVNAARAAGIQPIDSFRGDGRA